MPPRTDFLTKQRQQIEARLKELQPAHEEYLTLLKARDALAAVKPDGRRGPGRPAGRRGPGRPRGSRTGTARTRTTARTPARNGRRTRRARGRRANTRADQALSLIKQNPGIKVPEIATKMGIRQNYLYRVTAGLEKQRLVRRRDGGFHAA
jgi:MarR family